jgi:hypothetical protein
MRGGDIMRVLAWVGGGVLLNRFETVPFATGKKYNA